jgi:hypothetical protein
LQLFGSEAEHALATLHALAEASVQLFPDAEQMLVPSQMLEVAPEHTLLAAELHVFVSPV